MTDDATSDDPESAVDAATLHVQRRGVRRVQALTVALVAGTAALAAAAPVAPTRSGPWWMIVAVLVGYLAASRFVFHIEYRRDAVTFTMSEVPTALALVFLSPVAAIAMRLAGAVGPMLVPRRAPAYKLWFNASLFAFELAVAYTVLHGITGLLGHRDGALVLALIGATATSSLIGPITVPAAIACFDGGYSRRMLGEIRTGALMGAISATVAGIAASPTLIAPGLVLIVPIPIGAVWLVVRRYGMLQQRQQDLEEVTDFVRVIGRTLRLDDIARVALDSALESLRAGRGTLQVFGPDGSVTTVHHANGGLLLVPNSTGDEAWADILGAPSAIGYDVTGTLVRRDDSAGVGRLAVPIGDQQGLVGLLLVADRLGAAPTFGPDDIGRASLFGDQLAAHLRNAMLHAEIEHAAHHDALTGSLNRAAFEERVHHEIGRSDAASVAVLLLDLDRFKEVNDTLGHEMGDRVLIEFSRQVKSALQPGDVFARFGGDEFAVLVRRPYESAIRDLADRLVARSHRALHLDGYDVVVATSVGISLLTPADTAADGAIRRADIAMFNAKHNHLGYEMYREEIDLRTPARLAMVADLRKAIERDEIEVCFQPKLDLATSTVVGAEALARWSHPITGAIEPDEFIRVAEESGLIRQVTDRVFDLALTALADWRRQGYDIGIAINLSALDLVDEHLADRIAERLDHHRIPSAALMLEITESSLMVDTPRTMETIARLEALGVGLSVDDFGTGYSSLSYLRQLPADELKIDRSFVANMLLDAQDEVIVHSTIDLGHNLGLRVVAEGAENERMIEALRASGCDLVQGYGVSRPLNGDQFERWLASTGHRVEGRRASTEAPRRRASDGAVVIELPA